MEPVISTILIIVWIAGTIFSYIFLSLDKDKDSIADFLVSILWPFIFIVVFLFTLIYTIVNIVRIGIETIKTFVGK